MPNDWILALDTGTPTASVAVASREAGAIFQRNEPARTHGPTVLVLVESVLAEAGLTPADLAAVACGRGPGSFTGLRIGLATAKGLCFALGVPLLAPSSLEALARAVARGLDSNDHAEPTTVVACLDARRQEIFAAAWRFEADTAPTQLFAPMAGGPAAVAEAVQALDATGPTILAGTGATLYHDELTALLGDRATLPDGAPQTPDAAVLAELAAEQLARGDTANLSATEPEYLRPSDAELNRTPPTKNPSTPQ